MQVWTSVVALHVSFLTRARMCTRIIHMYMYHVIPAVLDTSALGAVRGYHLHVTCAFVNVEENRGARGGMGSWSYNKWDHVEDSDEDEDTKAPKEALLNDKKTFEQHERDNAIAKQFVDYLERFENKIPERDRVAVARFISVCDKRGEQSNILRYSEIIGVCNSCRSELLKLQTVDALCGLHQSMMETAPSESLDKRDFSHPIVRDTHLLMDAINTLEACRRVPNLPAFFEEICTPSRSAKAKELTRTYVVLDFGKRAMMRYIFKGTADKGEEFRQLLEDEEDKFDAQVNGAEPAGSSARKVASKGSAFWGEDGALLAMTFAVILVAIAAAGFGMAYLYRRPPALQE